MRASDQKQARAADELVARCDCGWEARGAQADLVPKIQDHALQAHGLQITPDQALAQARPVS